MSHYPSLQPTKLYPSERRKQRRVLGEVRTWLRENGYGWKADGTFGFLCGADPSPPPAWSIEGRKRAALWPSTPDPTKDV